MYLRPLGGLKVTLAKGEPMQPEITIHDYPCGSGKTTAMIESFKEDRKYLVILPLLSEVDRIFETARRCALANLLKMTMRLEPRKLA